MSAESVLSFRVGAQNYAVRADTLARFPETVLARALAFPNSNSAFWDRDQDVFASVLDLYRTGRFLPPPNTPIERVRAELAFWGFDLDTTSLAPEALWPLVPEAVATRAPRIRAPLAVSLRAMDGGYHAALACLAWGAIVRTKCLWDAASVGRRAVAIRWCAESLGAGLVCSLFLRDHLAFLSELAALDACVVSFDETAAVPDPRDMVTTGMVSSSTPYRVVHDWALPLKGIEHRDNDIVLLVEGTQRTVFLHRGFRITLTASGRRVWWSMDIPDQEEPRPWTMEDTSGFLLQISVIIDDCEMAIGVFPTPHARGADLSASAYLTSRYEPPEGAGPQWYLDRQDFEASAVYVDDGVPESGPREVRLLVEERLAPTMCATPAAYSYGNVLPFSLTIRWTAAA